MYFTFEPSDIIIAIIVVLVFVILLPFIFKIVNYFRFKELCVEIEIISNKMVDLQTDLSIQLNKLNARTELTNMYLKELIGKNLTEKKEEIQENEEKKVL